MLYRFLSDCHGVTVRRHHIYSKHFVNVAPIGSYFMVQPDAVIDIIDDVINFNIRPVRFRKEGRHKIIVWIDYGSIVGLYRKMNAYTTQFAIVITNSGRWATVRFAYPDGRSLH